MAIITLMTGAFSGASELARCLSEELGYRLVSREDLIDETAQYGMSRERRERARRWHLGIFRPMDLEWVHYLVYERAALSKEVQRGNLIYLGDNGSGLLRDFPNVLSVRIVADMEYRIDRLVGRTDYVISRKKARRMIERIDEKRVRWQRALYDEWHDTSVPDLVIDTGGTTVPEACDLVRSTIEQPQYQSKPKTLETVELLAVAAELRARIAMESDVADEDVEVGVKDGVIVLAGSVPSAEDLHAIKELLD